MSWKPTLAYCPNCGEQSIVTNHRIWEGNAGDACLCTLCWNGYYGIDTPYEPDGSITDGMKADYIKETK